MKHCFQSIDFGFAYDFRSILPKLTEIGPVTALGGNAEVNLVSLQRSIQRSPSPHRVKASPPQWLTNIQLNPMRVELSQYKLTTATSEIIGSLNFRHQEKLSTLKVETQLINENGDESASAQSYLQANNLTEHLFGPWDLSGNVKLDFNEKGRAHLKLKMEPGEQHRYRYQIDADFHSDLAMGTAKSIGILESDKIEGSYWQDVQLRKKSSLASAQVNTKSSRSHIRVNDCHFGYFQIDQKQESGKIKMNCPVLVDIPSFPNARFKAFSKALKLKRSAVLNIKADLNAPYPLALKRPIEGSISIEPERLFSKVVRTQGEVQTQLAVILINLPQIERLDSKIGFQAEIPEFADLVHALSKSILAIPAPFQALRGPVRLGVDGELNQKGGMVSGSFQSELSSRKKTQRLALKTDGTLKIDLEKSASSLQAKVDTLLSDIRFTFPKLELTRTPQILPDERLTGSSISKLIKKGTRSSKVHLNYNFDVRTPPNHPIKIASGLTESPIPIDVDLNVRSPGDLLGTIRIRQFPLKLLGGEKEIGQVLIELDTEKQQGIPMGQIQLKTSPSEALTEVPPAQLAGKAAGQAASTRAGPKFSVPAVRVLSSLFLGVPLDEVSLEPNVATRPPNTQEEKDGSQFLQLRKRY
jgi:hypothetical protein